MADHRHEPSAYTRFASLVDASGPVPCADIPEVFFPEDFPLKAWRDAAVATARQLCSGCPIRLPCFEYAVESNQRFGVWAGTLPAER